MRSLWKKVNFLKFKLSKVFSDIPKYACTVSFPRSYKKISERLWGVWSKSPISQKIVPWNRNSKSMKGKQFINVRWGLGIEVRTSAWSKLMKIGVPISSFCHFLSEHFHTLKIESDFFSRQGYWTLYRTAVYDGILLKKKQRRSCFYGDEEMRMMMKKRKKQQREERGKNWDKIDFVFIRATKKLRSQSLTTEQRRRNNRKD